MKRSWSIIYAISSFTFALGVFRSCSTFLPAHVCALMWLIIKRPAQLALPSTTLHAVPFPPSPLTPLSARRRVAKKLPSWVATSKARQGHSPLSSSFVLSPFSPSCIDCGRIFVYVASISFRWMSSTAFITRLALRLSFIANIPDPLSQHPLILPHATTHSWCIDNNLWTSVLFSFIYRCDCQKFKRTFKSSANQSSAVAAFFGLGLVLLSLNNDCRFTGLWLIKLVVELQAD